VGKWEMVKLGEVTTVVSGSTPKTSVNEYWNGEHNWVTPAELNDSVIMVYETERKITNKAIEDYNLTPLPLGTVLLTSRAPIGKVAIAGVEMYCNQGFKNIICSDKIHNKYLFWFLKGRTDFLNSLGRGATFKEISKSIVEQIQVPLPPIETQKQIAKTLDTVAELLAMRKQQLAELDNLIKSTFYDMFGDLEHNSCGWEERPLKDIAEIVSGITKGRKLRETETKVIPYLRVANVQDGYLDLTDIKYIEVADSEIEKYRLFKGDLLMTEGGDPDKLGRCAIWNEEIPFCIHQNHIFRVRLDQKRVLPEYACFLIQSPYGKKYFLKAAKQTTGIASINSKQISNFPLLIPNIKLQTKFAEIVTKFEEPKAMVQKAIDETQYLFDSLMSEYFD